MRNKLFLIVGLCAISFGVCKVQAENLKTSPISFVEVNIPVGYNEIDLHGELMLNIGPNAVVAGASDNAVYIGFNQDFGNVSINIYNGAGLVVYSTVVNTSVQQVVIIPITFATSGTYTVELSNAFGYADGDFEHLNNN